MNDDAGLIVVEEHFAISLSAALSSQHVQHVVPHFRSECVVDVKSPSDEVQKPCPTLAVRIESVSDVKGVGNLPFLIVESQALQAGNDVMRGAKLFQALIG